MARKSFLELEYIGIYNIGFKYEFKR